MQRCWCFLQRWEFAEAVLLFCSSCGHTPQFSYNPTHGNLMGSDPVTVVANSFYRHDQSISLGIYDSDTAWRLDWNEVALRHGGSISVFVFVQEHSVSVLAVHLAKCWRKYPLSQFAEKCTDQWVGHQWHNTTRLRQRDVGSCLREFQVDYYEPINGSFLFFFDPIAGKMGHVGGQNVTNQRQNSSRWTPSTLTECSCTNTTTDVLPAWLPHFSQVVRQYLNHKFPNRWIGRGGIKNWPPRSPDLNPLDYHVWGHMKVWCVPTRWTREKNCFSEFSALQEASTTLQCFVMSQVLWADKSENLSKQMEDTSNNSLECWTASLYLYV